MGSQCVTISQSQGAKFGFDQDVNCTDNGEQRVYQELSIFALRCSSGGSMEQSEWSELDDEDWNDLNETRQMQPFTTRCLNVTALYLAKVALLIVTHARGGERRDNLLCCRLDVLRMTNVVRKGRTMWLRGSALL